MNALTDEELSALVAEKVAGWTRAKTTGFIMDIWTFDHPTRDMGNPKFATSADAVLPLLEKYQWSTTGRGREITAAIRLIAPEPARFYTGQAETLPRAICLALLAAHNIK